MKQAVRAVWNELGSPETSGFTAIFEKIAAGCDLVHPKNRISLFSST